MSRKRGEPDSSPHEGPEDVWLWVQEDDIEKCISWSSVVELSRPCAQNEIASFRSRAPRSEAEWQDILRVVSRVGSYACQNAKLELITFASLPFRNAIAPTPAGLIQTSHLRYKAYQAPPNPLRKQRCSLCFLVVCGCS